MVRGPNEWRVPTKIVKRGPCLMEDQLSAVVFMKVWACVESSQKFFVQTETSCLVSFEISRLHPHNFLKVNQKRGNLGYPFLNEIFFIIHFSFDLNSW